MPPRSTRKAEAHRAASPPPPVAKDASPRPVPVQSPFVINSKHVQAPVSSLAAQAIPSAIVWIAFTGSVYLTIPPTPIQLQTIPAVSKISAIILGIMLALSSANIIPKISHQILLFITIPLYALQSNLRHVASFCSHMFLYSQKVTAYLSGDAGVQQALSLALLLLVLYSVSGRSSFGRQAAVICIYSAIAYVAFTSALAPSETVSELRALTPTAVLIFLAAHQFFDAPNAPAAYRNVFLAVVYYMAIKFSLTLQKS